MDEFLLLPEDNEKNLRIELEHEKNKIKDLLNTKKTELADKIRQMEEEPFSIKASENVLKEKKKKILILVYLIAFVVLYIIQALAVGILLAFLCIWIYVLPGLLALYVSKALTEGYGLFGVFRIKNGKLKKAYRKVNDDEKTLIEELRSKLAQCDEEAENEINILEKNIASRISSYNENYNIAVEEAGRYYNGSATANAIIDFMWATVDDKIKKADRDKFTVSQISVSDSKTMTSEGLFDEEGDLVYSLSGRIDDVTLPVLTAFANIISNGLVFRGNMEYTEDISGGECEFSASAVPEKTVHDELAYRITVNYKAKNKAYFE